MAPLTKHRITVEEYERMAEVGVFDPDARLELIEGEIVEMPPIGTRHACCTDRINMILAPRLVGRAIVRVQGPIRAGKHSEPQPDIVVLALRPESYLARHPEPDAVLLLIEVSDTSGDVDRDVKGPLYRRENVRDYWIVDVAADVIEVHRGDACTAHRRGESITPLAFPDLTLSVDEILG